MRRVILTLSAIVAGLFILSGCSKDEKQRPVPNPPSVETIKPNITSFSSTKASTGEFYSFVANSVLSTWNFMFNTLIDVPLKGIEHISKVTAEQIDNSTWMWKDSFKEGLSTYTVALVGSYRNDDTLDWELRVSGEGALSFDDFCWIKGWSSADGKKGQWTVQAGPSEATAFVTSDWETDGEYVTSVALSYALDLDYHGIPKKFNGSTLTVSRGATDSAYDTTIQTKYYQIGFGWITTTIEWNQKTGAGRFTSDSNWGSGWHCWGSDKSNADGK